MVMVLKVPPQGKQCLQEAQEVSPLCLWLGPHLQTLY